MKRFVISAWCAIAFLAALSLGTAFLSIYFPPDTKNGLYVLNSVSGASGGFAAVFAFVMIFVTVIVLDDSDE